MIRGGGAAVRPTRVRVERRRPPALRALVHRQPLRKGNAQNNDECVLLSAFFSEVHRQAQRRCVYLSVSSAMRRQKPSKRPFCDGSERTGTTARSAQLEKTWRTFGSEPVGRQLSSSHLEPLRTFIFCFANDGPQAAQEKPSVECMGMNGDAKGKVRVGTTIEGRIQQKVARKS